MTLYITFVLWTSRPQAAWEAVEITLGSCFHLHVRGPGLDPTDLGATIVVAPGQIPGNFLPSPNADCLPFSVKLVPCVVYIINIKHKL